MAPNRSCRGGNPDQAGARRKWRPRREAAAVQALAPPHPDPTPPGLCPSRPWHGRGAGKRSTPLPLLSPPLPGREVTWNDRPGSSGSTTPAWSAAHGAPERDRRGRRHRLPRLGCPFGAPAHSPGVAGSTGRQRPARRRCRGCPEAAVQQPAGLWRPELCLRIAASAPRLRGARRQRLMIWGRRDGGGTGRGRCDGCGGGARAPPRRCGGGGRGRRLVETRPGRGAGPDGAAAARAGGRGPRANRTAAEASGASGLAPSPAAPPRASYPRPGGLAGLVGCASRGPGDERKRKLLNGAAERLGGSPAYSAASATGEQRGVRADSHRGGQGKAQSPTQETHLSAFSRAGLGADARSSCALLALHPASQSPGAWWGWGKTHQTTGARAPPPTVLIVEVPLPECGEPPFPK